MSAVMNRFYRVSQQVDHFRCNELNRWKAVIGDRFSVRLHHWIKGDPPTHQHAHPWNFLTVVLWGGYDDVGEGRPADCLRAPTIRYRPTTWRHAVTNVRPHTWTVVITGRVIKPWRYWLGRSEVDEATWNHRVCD